MHQNTIEKKYFFLLTVLTILLYFITRLEEVCFFVKVMKFFKIKTITSIGTLPSCNAPLYALMNKNDFLKNNKKKDNLNTTLPSNKIICKYYSSSQR